MIKEALEEELLAAHRRIARTPSWRSLRKIAAVRLERVLAEVAPHATTDKICKRPDRFAQTVSGTLFHDLFGNKSFTRAARHALIELLRDEPGPVDADSMRASHEAQRRTRERTAPRAPTDQSADHRDHVKPEPTDSSVRERVRFQRLGGREAEHPTYALRIEQNTSWRLR